MQDAIKDIERAQDITNESYIRNKALNEKEISQGKTMLDSKPRGLGITLTNRCNIRCIMCSVWQNRWDIPEKTVREIIRLFPYLERIFYQGGEVFLSPYFEEILDRAALYPNLRQDINTNGLLIDRHWAEKLTKVNANIIFSIDGITKQTFEYIRKGAKFEDLLKGIQTLNECRDAASKNNSHSFRSCSTLINLVVMKSNYHELPDFIDFAKKYHFDRLQFTPVDVDDSENIFRYKDEKALSFIRRVIPDMLKRGAECDVDILNWLPMSDEYSNGGQIAGRPQQSPLKMGSEYRQDSLRPNSLSCYWPWQFLFIDWGGKVRPQCFCRMEVGNVENDTIEVLWNNEQMQEYRRRLYMNDFENWCDKRCIYGSIPKGSLGLD